MTRKAILAATAFAAVMAKGATAMADDAVHPTVVELFQSQGCSSCPPANANVMALSDRPDLLTLSLGVTYWDQLGWKDTFASEQFTARQWEYAHALHHAEVYTPQVVVNGRADIVGSDKAALVSFIHDEARRSEGPDLTANAGIVSIGAGNAAPRADVWLVRYDPRIVNVPVSAGENAGRTLPHKNVVRELVKLGEWSGAAATYAIPQVKADGLRQAILVQEGPGGPILTSLRL
jgi:hypothetical protein